MPTGIINKQNQNMFVMANIPYGSNFMTILNFFISRWKKLAIVEAVRDTRLWPLLLYRGLYITWKKKSNFVGFLETNSQKNWPISWEFRGSFGANFTKKQSVKNGRFCGYFQGKFH